MRENSSMGKTQWVGSAGETERREFEQHVEPLETVAVCATDPEHRKGCHGRAAVAACVAPSQLTRENRSRVKSRFPNRAARHDDTITMLMKLHDAKSLTPQPNQTNETEVIAANPAITETSAT